MRRFIVVPPKSGSARRIPLFALWPTPRLEKPADRLRARRDCSGAHAQRRAPPGKSTTPMRAANLSSRDSGTAALRARGKNDFCGEPINASGSGKVPPDTR